MSCELYNEVRYSQLSSVFGTQGFFPIGNRGLSPKNPWHRNPGWDTDLRRDPADMSHMAQLFGHLLRQSLTSSL